MLPKLLYLDHVQLNASSNLLDKTRSMSARSSRMSLSENIF